MPRVLLALKGAREALQRHWQAQGMAPSQSFTSRCMGQCKDCLAALYGTSGRVRCKECKAHGAKPDSVHSC